MVSNSQAAGITAVAATGMFAGAALYIQTVESPSLQVVAGNQRMLGPEAKAIPTHFFKAMYGRASTMQGGLATLAGTSALAGALNATTPDERNAFLVGAALIGGVLPFTALIIFPINSAIVVNADEGIMAPPSLFNKWTTLHGVRVAMSVASLGVMLFALHKSHHNQ